MEVDGMRRRLAMAIWLPLTIVVSACGTTEHDDSNGSGGTGASGPSGGASGGTADGSGGSSGTGGADNTGAAGTGGQSTGSTGGAEGGACVQQTEIAASCAELVGALGGGGTLNYTSCAATGHSVGDRCADPTYGPCVCANTLGSTEAGPTVVPLWLCPACDTVESYPAVPDGSCNGLPADVGTIQAGVCLVLSCTGWSVPCDGEPCVCYGA